MAADEPQISVVIPCLDEEEAVGAVVDQAWRGIEASGRDGEVIVVDNGSSDQSAEVAAAHGATVVEEPRRGYGSAYLTGLAHARGEYVVMGDADGTYPLDVLHFPVRTPAQLERKYLSRQPEIDDPHVPAALHVRETAAAIRADGAEAVFLRLLVDDDVLASGLEGGLYAVDARLRDALRGERGAAASRDGLAGLVEEVAALRAFDAAARLEDRVAWLERRLDALEASTPRSLLARVRRARGGRAP